MAKVWKAIFSKTYFIKQQFSSDVIRTKTSKKFSLNFADALQKQLKIRQANAKYLNSTQQIATD